MSSRRAVWEVARREVVERSRSRVLRVSLVLLLVLSVGGAIAAARLSGRTPTDDVGLVGARSVALGPTIRLQEKAAGRKVHLHQLDAAAAWSAVRNGSINIAVLDGRQLLVKTSRTGSALRAVQQAVAAQAVLDRLHASGLTQAQALAALNPARLPVNVIEPRPHNYDRNQGLVAAGLLVWRLRNNLTAGDG